MSTITTSKEMRLSEEGEGLKTSQSSNSVGPLTSSGSSIRLIAWNETIESEGERDGVESYLKIPSNLMNALNLFLVFFLPLVCTFVIFGLPFPNPKTGFVHNYLYTCISAPIAQSIFNVFQVYWASICTNTPVNYRPVYMNFVLLFIALSILSQTTPSWPLPAINPAGMTVVGVLLAPSVYFFNFPRKVWGTKDHKERFARFNKLSNVINWLFIVCMMFLFAAVLLPQNWKIPLTIILHCFVFALETTGIRISRSPAISPKYHNMFVFFSQVISEVFLLVTFPSVNEYWYFLVVFIVRVVFLARFPLLLTQKWWDWTQTVKEKLDPSQKMNKFSVFEGFLTMLGIFIPVSYTREEYNHRILETFAYTMWSYTTVPLWYLSFAPFLKWGYNKNLFTYKVIPDDQFLYSMYYTAASAVGFFVVYLILSYVLSVQKGNSFWYPTKLGLIRFHNNRVVMLFGCMTSLTFTIGLLIHQYNLIYWAWVGCGIHCDG